ncbi:hypothetical protein BpHYR1_012829 [Brachionus plicatilis]|uniref:Uncharacterized protein n=1 Tax=Brachionus plicatilis TaxID=10195 RepID=A0A3M7RJN4_BRAPC|nr:hypothetical protein BpHYR1_012829 [Brachionus plicatilis]
MSEQVLFNFFIGKIFKFVKTINPRSFNLTFNHFIFLIIKRMIVHIHAPNPSIHLHFKISLKQSYNN